MIPLPGVVDRDGQVIGDADILAGQDHVAAQLGPGGDQAVLATSGPWPSSRKVRVSNPHERFAGRVEGQAPGEGFSSGEASGLLVGGEGTAAEHLHGAVGGAGHGLGHLLAGAEAAIGEAAGGQAVEGALVVGQVVGLAEDGSLPLEAQPGEVLDEAGLELGAAAGGVDILDAHDEAAASLARGLMGGERGIGVPPVQAAGGRGGKASGEGDHGTGLGQVGCGNPWRVSKATAASDANQRHVLNVLILFFSCNLG